MPHEVTKALRAGFAVLKEKGGLSYRYVMQNGTLWVTNTRIDLSSTLPNPPEEEKWSVNFVYSIAKPIPPKV